jgi:hypothetical protein
VNRVVAHFVDGRIIKGMTTDFSPAKDHFHLSVVNAPAGADPMEIRTAELKALFFVKDHAGDPEHVERKEFNPLHPPAGRPIRVVFMDGEVLVGTTTGYSPERSGFFLEPADAGSNNERCYAVAAATREISFL